MIVRDHEYLIRQLPLMTQFSLGAKLSPVVALMALQRDRVELRRTFPKSFVALCETMPVEEHRWIIETCMGTITRKDDVVNPPVYVPVWVGGMPAFQDVDLSVMLELIWEVIEQHRLIDFFSVVPSSSTERRDGSSGSSGSGSPQTEKLS